jgi:hypothetical protein
VPSDNDAVIVPESEALLPFQWKLTASAPEGVAPAPVPIVAQPAAPTTITSGNAAFAIKPFISHLLLHRPAKLRQVWPAGWWINISRRLRGDRCVFSDVTRYCGQHPPLRT